MSGHNKWSTIKRKKGALDAKRSKIFSKIIKEITVAVKESGADPNSNPRLRLAIANAKGASMPKDNIQRAISKGADKDAASFVETTFEGYANGGIAIFLEATTDNTQRTISNVRSYFNKFGGNLGTNGSLSFIFDRKGIFAIPQGNLDRDEFEMEMIDAGAEDIQLEDGTFTITTAMEDFGPMMKKLEEMHVEPESAELQRIPKDTTTLDLESAKKVMRLVDIFEEDDDIQAVYHNMTITDELMEALD
ncbi:MAG TPA: YebC/PmpR family DNA-binding transcriptional regulator [Bacteroidales bacterium]|nr:YebC/PmpR family DNA-binding transcriptional regulator [Bacteroidales bacterium]HPT01725.1 YebC/PmpR family DNA-binding transcriptional regulator [Bacteroidales bacterium]